MSNFRLVRFTNSPITVNTTLNPLGEWNNSTSYVVADVVSYQGSSYICIADNNNTLPTDTAYWMVLAEAGSNTVTVRNNTGSTLYKGTVVYFNGSSGNYPTVAKALATGDATSAQTIGFVFADISNNSEGEVITEGNLYDLDTRTTATHPFTSDTLANGQQLYLSPDTAGYVTNVKPSAPDHLVYVGTVINTGTSNGEIFVKVMNGFELQELHNVAITSVADNDIIQYDSATQLWKNEVLNKSSVGLGNVDNTSDANKPISTATQTALDGKVDENTAITGATKTKITYDAKGLVTAGADATTSDIADSTDKRYVTDSQSTVLGNTSGTNTGDETQSTIKTKLGAATTSVDGYLTSTDWNTFNGKQAALGFTPEDIANKSTTTTLGTSNTLYPTQNAVKTYADTQDNLRVLKTGDTMSGVLTLSFVSANVFSSGLQVFKTGTTGNSLAAVTNTSEIGYHTFHGYTGSSYKRLAYVIVKARGDISTTAGGGDYTIATRGNTNNTEANRLTINELGLTITDAHDIIIGTTTGTKIATTTLQKIGFWNATPIVQPTTAVAESAFVANAGGVTVTDDSTFDGYTIRQVVKALRNAGLLA